MLLVVGSLAVLPGVTAFAAPLGHHGDALVQVSAPPAEVEALGLDVWTHGATGPSVVARVTLQQRALLDASGLDYVVIDPDLGPRVAAERARLLATPPVQGGGLDPAFHQDYRAFAAVLTRLADIAAAAPARVTPVEVGLSLEGRVIQGIRITNPGAADRPVVVVQACQHAREWISVAATMFAAEQLATAAEGTSLDLLLDQVELVVVPVANPDGYVHSWTDDRFWRKNRRDGIGVDTNRNWSVAWGGEGASADPGSDSYHGTGPFSEPEPAAMRDFIDADPRVIAMLDVHAYGRLVLYPWGYVAPEYEDHAIFSGLAADVADLMTSRHAQQYVPLQSVDLYPASGNSIDWAYGTHGIYALGLELRPGPESDTGFVLSPDEIVPTGEELLEAIVELAESAVELGPGEPGGVDTGTTGDDTTGALDGTTTTAGDGTSSGAFGSSSGDPTLPPGETDFEPPAATDYFTSDRGSGDAPPLDGDSPDGCACRQSEDPRGAWWAFAGLLGLALRRRGR